MSLRESIGSVYRRISHAAVRAGKDPSAVTLIAAAKTVPAEVILEAIDAGVRLIGENRVHEARQKIESLRKRIPDSVSWHMIGHLQRNKAALAVSLFDMIQSVDSRELARILDRSAAKIGKVQRVLVQVKLVEEAGKSGIAPAGLMPLLDEVVQFEHVALEGLMTIPPLFTDPEDVRPYFRQLREIRDGAADKGFHLPELSMGMSGDFEIAVEEGATMVRIGSALFGERDAGKRGVRCLL